MSSRTPSHRLHLYARIAHPATGHDVVAQLSDTLAKALNAPETRSVIETQGMDAGTGRPEEFAALLRREYERYAKVVKMSGAKID